MFFYDSSDKIIFFFSLCFVIVPNVIQRRAELQNCTLSLVEITVSDGSETEQLVQDQDCANKTHVPDYNFFKVGHIFTGEVSRNWNHKLLIVLLYKMMRGPGYRNETAANPKGFFVKSSGHRSKD